MTGYLKETKEVAPGREQLRGRDTMRIGERKKKGGEGAGADACSRLQKRTVGLLIEDGEFAAAGAQAWPGPASSAVDGPLLCS